MRPLCACLRPPARARSLLEYANSWALGSTTGTTRWVSKICFAKSRPARMARHDAAFCQGTVRGPRARTRPHTGPWQQAATGRGRYVLLTMSSPTLATPPREKTPTHTHPQPHPPTPTNTQTHTHTHTHRHPTRRVVSSQIRSSMRWVLNPPMLQRKRQVSLIHTSILPPSNPMLAPPQAHTLLSRRKLLMAIQCKHGRGCADSKPQPSQTKTMLAYEI